MIHSPINLSRRIRLCKHTNENKRVKDINTLQYNYMSPHNLVGILKDTKNSPKLAEMYSLKDTVIYNPKIHYSVLTNASLSFTFLLRSNSYSDTLVIIFKY